MFIYFKEKNELNSKYIDQVLSEFGVEIEINEQDLSRIPTDAPFLCIANRKYPGIDELLLFKLFESYPRAFKMLTFVKTIHSAELKDSFFHLPLPKRLTSKPTYDFEALKMPLVEGDSLGIFLSHLPKNLGNIRRNHLHKKLFKKIKELNVSILPVCIDFENPIVSDFNTINDINSSRKVPPVKVRLRIGKVIKPIEYQGFKSILRFRKFVQSVIYALGSALDVRKLYGTFQEDEEEQAVIIDPITVELLAEDIAQLTFENLLFSYNEYDIFAAPSKNIPNILREIGRLREITFRAVGEGSGKDCDLDEYDIYYHQLFIWDREAKKIVGGYRLGKGDEIFQRFGKQGFYVHSLFKIKPGFYPIMNQSVELGRSFVVEEYQKKRMPLFMLWKGILYFLVSNPNYRYLYGPMSISKYYSEVSKSIIVEFVRKNYYDENLARFLKPRKPFKFKKDKINMKVVLDQMEGDLKNLNAFIETIEPDHMRIPVLLRQYVKQNARFISFNLDPKFSDVLDGFMILDLNDVPYETIAALKKK